MTLKVYEHMCVSLVDNLGMTLEDLQHRGSNNLSHKKETLSKCITHFSEHGSFTGSGANICLSEGLNGIPMGNVARLTTGNIDRLSAWTCPLLCVQ